MSVSFLLNINFVIIDNFIDCLNYALDVFVLQSIIQRQAQGFLIICFPIGAETLLITQAFIPGVPVYRQVMYLGMDIFCTQGIEKLSFAAV